MVACVLCLLLASAGPDAGARRVFVLDAAAPSVSAISLADAELLQRRQLEDPPQALLYSAGARRLIVLASGTSVPGARSTGARASATLFDRSLEAAHRIDLGLALHGEDEPFALLGADGDTLTVIARGYGEAGVSDPEIREVLTADLHSGLVVGRLGLLRDTDHILATRDAATLVLFSRSTPAEPAQLAFFDLRAQASLARLPLHDNPDPPVLSPDEGFLYLGLGGGAHGVGIVSMRTREVVARLTIGRLLQQALPDADNGQTYAVSRSTQGGASAGAPYGLHIIRGASLAGSCPLPAEPMDMRLSPDRRRLYVVGDGRLTGIDAVTLERSTDASWAPTGAESAELTVSSDGTRGVIEDSPSGELHLIDLAGGRHLASARPPGDLRRKLGVLLADAAVAVGATYVGTDYSVGSVSSALQRAPPLMSSRRVVFRKDGTIAYVLDSARGRIWALHFDDGRIEQAPIGGGHGLRVLDGGDTLAVLDESGVWVFDMAGHGAHHVALAAPGGLVMSPDGKRVLVAGGGTLVLLDGRTGVEVGRASGFDRPRSVVFGVGDE